MTRQRADRSFDYDAQDATAFLVHHFTTSGHNSKPVIWHSLRVAMRLYDEGFDRNTVLAALLHDLVEDTDVDIGAIRDEFGGEVARLVSALTFDATITDRAGRFQEHFERCKAAGPDAIAIMAADFLDNSFFYAPGDDEPLYRHVLWKARTFLADVESGPVDDRLAPILDDLQRSLERHPA